MTSGPTVTEAAAHLRAGGVVAFPTETVYGVAADLANDDAIRALIALKGRPEDNPLPVVVRDADMARSLAATWPTTADLLVSRFWPGPLSLVVRKSERIPDVVTAGQPTVGLRCPDHPLTLAMLEALGRPVVGPSANPSGAVAATTPEQVHAAFGDRVMILDGGPCRMGIESTVLALDEAGGATILRPGVIDAAEISRVIHAPASGPAGPMSSTRSANATTAPLRLFDAEAWGDVSSQLRAAEPAVVISHRQRSVGHPHVMMTLPDDPEAYAARLYRILAEADRLKPTTIWVERPPESGPVWRAVADRLGRAARPWN